jgi:deoxyribodipyrimidine photolyase
VTKSDEVPVSVTGQLIWREYFYCMSVNNPLYNKMEGNPVCLNIDWYTDAEQFDKWDKVRIKNNTHTKPLDLMACFVMLLA